MRSMLAALLILPSLAFAPAHADEPVELLKVGDALPAFQLNDQHDKPMPIGAETRALVFTADKSAGEVVNDLLKARPADFMPQRGIVYLADISRMPSFITSMIALPRMREYPYRMALATEEGQTAMLPVLEDHVTVLMLEEGKVREILQFKEAASAELAAVLDGMPVISEK